MIDPANVAAPMSTSSAPVVAAVGAERGAPGGELVDRQDRGGATADRVEEAHQLRHRRHRDPPRGDQPGAAAEQRPGDEHERAGRGDGAGLPDVAHRRDDGR
ncbi:hypothetical protein GCM10020218_058130 [Dactylosporangium vinaceum]